MKKLLLIALLPLLGIGQTQIGADIDGEVANNWSGYSVSLSADGNTVAIGAVFNDDGGLDAGHVRVYENIAGIWTQVGADIDGEAANDQSGWSVSLSADGSLVAIGAPYNDGNEPNSGHVRVYQNINGSWVQIGEDINGDGIIPDDNSGYSVSLSADGSVVAVGAPFSDGNQGNSGQVKVYQNIAGTWTQVGVDIYGEAAGDQIGSCVSLSADGNIVAIGSPYIDGNGSRSGQVRVYQNNTGTWTQVGADINGEADNDESGWSVSLSGDGNMVAIGARFNSGNGTKSGHVRVYQNIAGTWIQVGVDIDGEAANDYSGFGVSLSADDGSSVAIGAFGNDGNGIDSGHVRVYNISSTLSNDSFAQSDFIVYPNPTQGKISINLNDLYDDVTITVTNILGQKLKTQEFESINELVDVQIDGPHGIYFVNINSSMGDFVPIKIIKN